MTGGQRGAQFAKTGTSENIYEIETPSGRRLLPTKGRCWAASENRFIDLLKDNRIWFGKSGDNVPRIKRFLSEVQEGIVCMTLWLRTEVGDNQEAKREVMTFNDKELFATPKPERLLQRVIEIATNPGDLVLDSFAGSGTTGAVAHKMGRRWIMIELGEHCHTHIIPRLKKVIDGQCQTETTTFLKTVFLYFFELMGVTKADAETLKILFEWLLQKKSNVGNEKDLTKA